MDLLWAAKKAHGFKGVKAKWISEGFSPLLANSLLEDKMYVCSEFKSHDLTVKSCENSGKWALIELNGVNHAESSTSRMATIVCPSYGLYAILITFPPISADDCLLPVTISYSENVEKRSEPFFTHAFYNLSVR